jgi:hypothetical protein
MTAVREALVLPALFLSVTLLGSLRLGAALMLRPPTVFSLLLAVLLTATLVQSGAFDPRRVIHAGRSALANANGIAILASLFVAAAQVFSMLMPDSGLPRIVLGVYFLGLMLYTIAAGPDRIRLLRSLGVTFGSAFLLKFIVLDALSGPASGRLTRALQLLFEGATLGAITQEPQHGSAGYFAFATLGLFLLAVWLLPARTAVAAVYERTDIELPEGAKTRHLPSPRP